MVKTAQRMELKRGSIYECVAQTKLNFFLFRVDVLVSGMDTDEIEVGSLDFDVPLGRFVKYLSRDAFLGLDFCLFLEGFEVGLSNIDPIGFWAAKCFPSDFLSKLESLFLKKEAMFVFGASTKPDKVQPIFENE